MARREPDASSASVPPPLPRQSGLQNQGLKKDVPGRGSPPGKEWHWPTVILAAVPATLLAFPAALAILFGFTFALGLKPIAFVMFFCGVLSWGGMIALWSAARSQGVVSKRTARGLVGGIIGVFIFFWIVIFGNDQDIRLWSFTPALTIGPLLFAVSYLRRYRKHLREAGMEPGGDSVTTGAEASEALPFEEVKMRKVLTLLLIIPTVVELIAVPHLLEARLGMGYVAVIAFSFPFLLGIAVTAIWCFRRSRALRGLAAAALVIPILLPFVIHWMSKGYGDRETTQITFVTAIAIPVLILLIVPKQVARFLPRFAIENRGFNVVWIWLLSVMLIPWAILAIFFRSLKETESQWAITFLLCYAGVSIVVAVITLFMAYIGLRAQQSRQTGLRITQIGLSLLLLLFGGGIAAAILFIFILAGSG